MAPLVFWLDAFCAGVALCLLRVAFRRWRAARARPPLPPGPRGLPLIGNLLDMPSEQEWRTFARWGDQYGGLSSVTILGQTLVIVNDPKIATDLLDKRSSTFSDRPVMQMGGELVGWRNTLVLLPYGDRFRRFRRLFHQSIGTRTSIKQFHPAEEIETRRFLRRVLAQPDALAAHIRKYVPLAALYFPI